jgi:hypothetical protein
MINGKIKTYAFSESKSVSIEGKEMFKISIFLVFVEKLFSCYFIVALD